MTESEMIRCPESWQLDFQPSLKWDYCHGLELQAMLDVYDAYGDKKIYDYAYAYADTMIQADGSIKTYKLSEYNIDRLNSGKFLFRIFEQSKEEKFQKAIDLLRSQLDTHPRNADGGFWHKKIYPNQMWLDGIYMASPFLAEYAQKFNEPALYDEVAFQVITMAKRSYDPKTGLYYHGWDESRTQQWAHPVTGQSPNFWSRSMGWYMMALVDVLDYLPENHPDRSKLISIFNRLTKALLKYQDKKTGMWYQVTNLPKAKGNYLESTGTAMFSYAIAKGVNNGYLKPKFRKYAVKAFEGLVKHSIIQNADGTYSITRACSVAGLGGTPYRDGSYEYYISEPVRNDDPKVIGPFILAAMELDRQ
jgi:unsaturated rhamnogalacturonyl hydrolase